MKRALRLELGKKCCFKTTTDGVSHEWSEPNQYLGVCENAFNKTDTLLRVVSILACYPDILFDVLSHILSGMLFDIPSGRF